MTDGVGELGTVQGVEMKFLDAVLTQALHLLDRDVGRDHAARLRILIQSVEPAAQPLGYRRSATLRKTQHVREPRDGKNPRHDVRADPRGCAPIAIPQEHVRVEKELRDRAIGARVDFALEIFQIRLDGTGLRVSLGVGGDRDFEGCGAPQAAHQVGAEGEASGMRPVIRTGRGIPP